MSFMYSAIASYYLRSGAYAGPRGRREKPSFDATVILVARSNINLVEDLAAGPARLEVVVAFLGLLQGERAVDLCVGNTPETKAPWEPVPKSFLRGDGTANVVASNDCLIYGERACVTTIATDVCLIGNVRRRRPREKMRKEKG
jgi:hypothetical protein